MNKLLRIKNLTILLDNNVQLRRVADRVGFTVRRGRNFALLGESGSGKTCLIQSLLGLHEGIPGVVEGDATLLGVDCLGGLEGFVQHSPNERIEVKKDVAGWRKFQRKKLGSILGSGVTLIPQDPGALLSPFHTLARQLVLAAGKGARPNAGHRSPTELLSRVGMRDPERVVRAYPHELSGGMAQRATLALALAPEPEFIIADEPTTGLDPTIRSQILDLLASVAMEGGATLLLVTHDCRAAKRLASDVAIILGGVILESGSTSKVLDPAHRPKHPYTAHLLAAESALDAGGPLMFSGATNPPPAGFDIAMGCPFVPHCPKVDETCLSSRIAPVEVGEEHFIRCVREKQP